MYLLAGLIHSGPTTLAVGMGEMPKLSTRVYTILIAVVAVLWAMSVIISFLSYFTGGSYRPDPFVHAAFMIVVGALFGLRNKDGNGNDDNGGGKNKTG